MANCPNSVLVVLTVLSFLPQIRQIVVQKRSTGISLYNVVFSFVNATKLLALFSWVFLVFPEDSGRAVHSPRSLGDWLNASQLLWFGSCSWHCECVSGSTEKRVLGRFLTQSKLLCMPLLQPSRETEGHRRIYLLLYRCLCTANYRPLEFVSRYIPVSGTARGCFVASRNIWSHFYHAGHVLHPLPMRRPRSAEHLNFGLPGCHFYPPRGNLGLSVLRLPSRWRWIRRFSHGGSHHRLACCRQCCVCICTVCVAMYRYTW